MDSIIYCSDLAALKAKLIEDGYYDEESDTYNVPNQTLTPVVKNGNLSLSYVRNFQLDLSEYTMLEDLGSYGTIFSDPDKLAKYKSVYDYDTPITFTDDEGVEHTYNKPKKIGVFLS